jgi:hypothetical protein
VTIVTLDSDRRRRVELGVEALQRRPESVLLVLLIAGITSTALHYTDNAVYLERYPGPGWLSPAVIAVAWVGLTAIGVAGYRLYRQGRMLPACACLAVYSYTGISSLGHYTYGLSGYSFKQNLLIATDGLTGLAMLAFALWSARRALARTRTA